MLLPAAASYFCVTFLTLYLFPVISNCNKRECIYLYYNTSNGVINLNLTNHIDCAFVLITIPNGNSVSVTCTTFIPSWDMPLNVGIFDGSTTDDTNLFYNSVKELCKSGQGINSTQNTMLLEIAFKYQFNKDAILQFKYDHHTAMPCHCGPSTFTTNYGIIYSPLYEQHMNYCNNLDCTYEIEIYEKFRVFIKITNFYTEYGKDLLLVYEKDEVMLNISGLYTNGRKPQVQIPSNKVTLRFISNSEITHFGFRIEYTYFQDKCSCPEQNYIASFGVVLSPGYPEPGQQCLATGVDQTKDCLYRIVGTSGQTIFLNFTEFRLGNGSYLAMFDDSILLANYTWLDNDNGEWHNMTSTSSVVRLHVHMTLTYFLNDNQTLFKANYWLVDNPEPDSSIEIWYVLLPIIAVVAIVGLIVAICIFNRRSKREALIDLMQTFNAARRPTVASNDYDQTSTEENGDHDIWRISHKDLSLDREALLGSGAFGSVYKAKLNTTSPLCQSLSSYLHDKFTNCTVAVKMLGELANIHSKEVFLEEIMCMKSVGYCQYLVNMHGYSIRDNDYWLVLEYCSGGDLLKYVRNNCVETEGLLEEFDSFAWQIASGMEYLRSKQLVHRDLAARNVLLDEENRAKIGDFGLCRQLSRDVYVTHGGRLPIKWMAVESIRDHVFNSKSDVWSYGVLLYEIYSFGKEPFEFVAPREVIQLLLKGERLEKPDFCSDKIYDLMKMCWNTEPDDRPTFDQVRNVTAEHIMETTEGNANYLDLDSV